MPETLPVPESQPTTTSTDATTTTTIDANADATTTPTDTTTDMGNPVALDSPLKELADKIKRKFTFLPVETVREDGLPKPFQLTSSVAQFHQPMPKRFEVSIEAHPPLVIDALDEDEAWEKYKTRWGIISTDKRPVINYLESENGQSDNAGSSPAS